MSRLFLLPLALTLLILSPTTTLAQLGLQQVGQLPFLPSGQSSSQPRRLQRGQQALNDCQINQLSANEPSIRIQAEAGVTEVWDPKEQQEFQCAGVTVIRREVEPKGLLLPHYTNAPSISYVIRGRGLLGVSGLGCPDTYESGSFDFSEESRRSERSDEPRRSERSEESRRSERSDEPRRSERSEEPRRSERSEDARRSEHSDEPRRSERSEESRRSERGSERVRDQHQKVRRVHMGHVIALPAGVSKWLYNDGDERLTIVTLFDTSNYQNQLGDNLRSFFLAGNPQARGDDQSRRQHESSRSRSRHHETRGSEEEILGENNILSGFDKQLLADAYDVEVDTINRVQGQNDNRGAIVRVEGGELEMLIPEWDHQEEQRQRHHQRGGRGQREHERERRHRPDNGIEQTLCSARLSVNIDNPERADVFNPQGGRLTSINSQKLPILNDLRLSAEKVHLYQNAIMTPNWKINAHSIVYFTKGSGRVQIANHEGELVFDDVVQEGQLVVVPQNFVVLKRAGRDGLEWVALLTNDNAMSSPLAGRISAIRGMPIEVVMNSYKLSREEAQRLKYGRQELSVFSPSKRSSEERRGDEYAIL